jgi:NDP-hexose-3-ketoreductase
MVAMAEKIRIGALGCSDIAKRKFLPALQKAGKARLVAIASRDVAKARGFFTGTAYQALTYEELIASRNVDLVYISLPNHLHEQWTLHALESGKHVICEKPLGLSSESVRRMTGRAEERALLLYENMMYLHHPQHALIRNIVLSGKVGAIKILRAAYGFNLADKTNFRMNPQEGGGAFYDLLRYPVSTAQYFLDDDLEDCTGYALLRKGLVVGMHGSARMQGNTVFAFSVGFEQQYESYYEIVGERGSLRLDRAYTPPPDFENQIRVTLGAESSTVKVPPADQFGLMIDSVCSAISSGIDFGRHYQNAKRLARATEQVRAGCREVHLAE